MDSELELAALHARRKFFDRCRDGGEDGELAPGAIKFTCPCCGYPTLAGRGGFEVCYLCFWEDDGQDDADADEVRGGPNQSYSLAGARSNFQKHLVMYPPDDDPRISGPDSQIVVSMKRKIIAAFDQMLTERSDQVLNSLWITVEQARQSLRREMRRRVRGIS